MKKVILINFAGHMLTCNTFIPDNSLGLLAAWLMQHGYDCEIIDLQTPKNVGTFLSAAGKQDAKNILQCLSSGTSISENLFKSYDQDRHQGMHSLIVSKANEIAKKIISENIEFVGFKLWAGNGFQHSILLAELLKEKCPHIKIIGGGPAVRHGEELIYEKTNVFDFLCLGDGEEPILNFLNQQTANTRGLIYKTGTQTIKQSDYMCKTLNSLPAATYAHSIYPEAKNLFHTLIVDESRGCFNRCHFCSHPHFNHVTRKKDPKLVVDELEYANQEMGIQYFRFSGSNPPWKFLVSIADEILKRNLKIYYSAFSSLNNIDPKYLGHLAKSGLRALFFGVESADEKYLKAIHGKNNLDQDHIIQVCKQAMSHQIFVSTSVIVPSPFETKETKTQTLDLLKNIFAGETLGGALCLPSFLTKGSQWWNQMTQFGFQFNQGYNKDRYISELLDWDLNFLLPRSLCSDLGYTLNGKSFLELLSECEDFLTSLKKENILTDIDDASYMISLMGNLSPQEYKSKMISALIETSQEKIETLIYQVNHATSPALNVQNLDQPPTTTPHPISSAS